jgi:hypothetical protein
MKNDFDKVDDYLEAGYVKWQYDHDKKILEDVAKESSLPIVPIPIVPIVAGTLTGIIHGTILNSLTKLFLASKNNVTQG